jgi:hypothetical protein
MGHRRFLLAGRHKKSPHPEECELGLSGWLRVAAARCGVAAATEIPLSDQWCELARLPPLWF